jgi:hypothetical protein
MLECMDCGADGSPEVVLVPVVTVWRGATFKGADLPQSVDAGMLCIRCLLQHGEKGEGE